MNITNPKIAHITTVDISLNILLLNQLVSIRQSGYEVVGISAPGPNVPAIEAAGIHHIAIPMTRTVSPLADLTALWRLVQVLRREKITIVHGHTPKAELLGQLAARLAGVPIVVDTFRGIYYRSEMHPFWRWLFIKMAKLAAAQADVVLSQSREAMEMAIREDICPASKIKYLGNGIDINHFNRNRFTPDQVHLTRQKLGLPPHVPVIGFVGRLVREKGIIELLEAVRSLRYNNIEMHLLIIGPIDTEKPDALSPAIAQEYDLSDRVVFAGMQPPAVMPDMLAVMDVLVHPSYRESFPRSPMEAAAMSIPVVATDIPGCREAVSHGNNGLLVPLGDVSALAQAILDLMTNPELARQLGQAGRQLAEDRFDERLVFERVKAEYARLLKKKGFSVPQPLAVRVEQANVP